MKNPSALVEALFLEMSEHASRNGFEMRSRQIQTLATTAFNAIDALQDQLIRCETAVAAAAQHDQEREKLLLSLLDRVESLEATRGGQ